MLWTYVALCLSSTAAGAVNAIAGGGTLLTFPALVAALSATGLANATSTAALMPGTVASAWGFRDQLAGCRRWLILLAPTSLLGGAVGALLVEESSFKVLVPWLILTAAVLFLLQPAVARLVRRRAATGPPSRHFLALAVVAQFFIAVYGGYFGAGIGILMLSTLSFLDLKNIHQINAVKNVLALAINGTAAALFVARRMVVWEYALPMALASIVGGYVAARLSQRLPPMLIRAVVIVIGFSLAAYYFYRQYAPAATV